MLIYSPFGFKTILSESQKDKSPGFTNNQNKLEKIEKNLQICRKFDQSRRLVPNTYKKADVWCPIHSQITYYMRDSFTFCNFYNPLFYRNTLICH